eukprot:6175118-Pleurochrysis_carterae.AAC.2
MERDGSRMATAPCTVRMAANYAWRVKATMPSADLVAVHCYIPVRVPARERAKTPSGSLRQRCRVMRMRGESMRRSG